MTLERGPTENAETEEARAAKVMEVIVILIVV
jgi:hypothetical protein